MFKSINTPARKESSNKSSCPACSSCTEFRKTCQVIIYESRDVLGDQTEIRTYISLIACGHFWDNVGPRLRFPFQHFLRFTQWMKTSALHFDSACIYCRLAWHCLCFSHCAWVPPQLYSSKLHGPCFWCMPGITSLWQNSIYTIIALVKHRRCCQAHKYLNIDTISSIWPVYTTMGLKWKAQTFSFNLTLLELQSILLVPSTYLRDHGQVMCYLLI